MATNIHFIDIDEVILRTEGEGGYYLSWLDMFAQRFARNMRNVRRYDLRTGADLAMLWYGYKQLLATRYNNGQPLSHEQNERLWLKDTRNRERQEPFGPISFLTTYLKVDPDDFASWLAKMESTRFAASFLHKGTVALWRAIEASPIAEPVLLTKGEQRMQIHKAVSIFGEDARSITHVIQAGTKCAMLNRATRGKPPHRWPMPSGTVKTFDFASLIEDTRAQVADLADRPSLLGIYLTHREGNGGNLPGHIGRAPSLTQVPEILRSRGML